MKRITELVMVAAVALSACDNPNQPLSPGGPTASLEVNAVGTQVVTGDIGPGSTYRLDRPANWNGRLVLYAHGGVPPFLPVRLPPAAAPLRDALVARGYGFAYSSRSETGAAIQDGVQRTRQLLGLFTSKFGRPEQTYGMGTSMGGMIMIMLAEKNPGVLDGALPMCTFASGTQKLFDYWWNTRVVFDYFFPGVIRGDALHVPDDVDLATALPAVRQAMLADPARAIEMAGVDQLDIKYESFSELVDAVMGPLNSASILGLQINFTNNVLAHTHGHSPFDNTATVYAGSQNDAALNAGVDRFASTPDAMNFGEHYYQPDGNLSIPVLTLHTTRDPGVPLWHEAIYADIVAAQGRSDWLVQRSFDRFGHCTFTLPEQVTALEDLVRWAETGVKPAP
jgi:pimeloyl-ACP methyl ester carboxylesterase